MRKTLNYQDKQPISYKELAARAKAMSDNPNFKGKGGASDYFIFKITDSTDGDAAIMLSDLEPAFEGGDDAPDVLMEVSLIHFNISNQEDINRRTRATMRLTVEQGIPLDNNTKPLIWIASAGLKIYDIIKNGKSVAEDGKLADFNNAFGNRPIEIPKGQAKLSFDVIKHREPKWWQKVFQFIQQPTGVALTAALGFPGVTQGVVGVVDRLFSDILKSKSTILFESDKIDLTLTKSALGEGSDFEDFAVMTPGYFLICKGSDLGFFMNTPARYNRAINNLLPVNEKPAEFLAGSKKNPFDAKTFAIFKVGMQETKLAHEMIFKV